MNALRFATGFAAGAFDGLGWIGARDALWRCIKPTGRAVDGFDMSADWFVRRHLGDRVSPAEIDFDLDVLG